MLTLYDTCVTYLKGLFTDCDMLLSSISLKLIVTGDACMWGRKYSLFPEHRCGVYDFTQYKDYLRINDAGLFVAILFYYLPFSFLDHCKLLHNMRPVLFIEGTCVANV